MLSVSVKMGGFSEGTGGIDAFRVLRLKRRKMNRRHSMPNKIRKAVFAIRME